MRATERGERIQVISPISVIVLSVWIMIGRSCFSIVRDFGCRESAILIAWIETSFLISFSISFLMYSAKAVRFRNPYTRASSRNGCFDISHSITEDIFFIVLHLEQYCYNSAYISEFRDFFKKKYRVLFLIISPMYPYNLLWIDRHIYPILWDQYTGNPYIFDFTDSYYRDLPVRDTEYMNEHNMMLLWKSWKTWGIGGYLDDRSPKLVGTHIYDEWRVFHLGIDIMTQGVADIYNPLDWEIFEGGYEAWAWNYGGYVIMKYCIEGIVFYALFGHLDIDTVTQKSFLSQGEKMATLGTPEKNWNWVPHLHLQVFTGKDLDIWKFKWYCTLDDLRNMQYICPHPGFLLRYHE